MKQENVFGVFSLSIAYSFPLWPPAVPMRPLCDTLAGLPSSANHSFPTPLHPSLSNPNSLGHSAFWLTATYFH